MPTIVGLKLPSTWTTALPQDNNFDISRNELDDDLFANSPVDWANVAFINVATLNGIDPADFWTDTSNGNIGLLADVDGNVSSSPQEGDILYYDGAAWNRFPRGTDGQFLKSTVTGIAWGTGAAQIQDFADDQFSIFNAADATKIATMDASSIATATTRVYTFPDKNGTFAMLSDITGAQNEFDDSLFRVFDDVDNTKKLAFQTAGISTGTTRTATWPDKSGTVAFLDDITTPGNTFPDDLFRVFDNVDNTKLLAFQLSGFTTATTRTWTWPDADDTVVGLLATQTLQNKTIDIANNTIILASTDLSDTADLAYLNTPNIFLAGNRQTFTGDLAGTAGINVAPIAGGPTTKIDGDVWLDSVQNKGFMRINGADVDFTSAQPMPTSFVITASDESTDLDTLNNPKTTFRMPFAYTLNTVPLGVRASVRVAPVGSSIIVDIKQNGVSILSTLLTIDAGEKTSTTAAVPAVISTNPLTDDAEMSIEVTQVGSTTPGQGLKVYLIGQS
jgi:hypothetical protein